MLQAGDVVAGKYRIEKVVARGGMGVVYAAHHMLLDQRVALKVLLVGTDAPNEEIIERFVREAQAAARLQSEHVVRVMDVGSLEHGAPFLVMEYLHGCDLDELLSLNGPLGIQDVADYMLQALAALAQAHAAGIVHRDIKPANLFLAVRPDGTNVLKVVDFGISKQPMNQARWRKLTGEAMLGTPAYMSPEQLRNTQGVDARADIWSIGVVMSELLTGQIPFDGDSPGAAFAAILERDPVPIGEHRANVPPDIEQIILRCLRRDPADRFADVGELAARIATHGSGRWAPLLERIGETLAHPSFKERTEGAALEAAASAIALKSLPPPPMAGPDRDTATLPRVKPAPAQKEMIGLQKAPFTAAVPGGARPAVWPDEAPPSPRRARVAIAVGALAVLAIVALREVRGAPVHSASPVAALAPPAASASADVEVLVSPKPPSTGAPSASADGGPPGAFSVPRASSETEATGKRAHPPARPSFLRSRE